MTRGSEQLEQVNELLGMQRFRRVEEIWCDCEMFGKMEKWRDEEMKKHERIREEIMDDNVNVLRIARDWLGGLTADVQEAQEWVTQ